jgi:hypothetical protein
MVDIGPAQGLTRLGISVWSGPAGKKLQTAVEQNPGHLRLPAQAGF